MAQTILLTGASGFIAKHIALRLLEAGHHIRASVRAPARADEVRQAILPRLQASAAERLEFVTLHLDDDAGWADAAAGADAVVHTASPFPIVQPRDADELVRPAVEGTLRALRAARAAGVRRVVVTSSVAAVTGCPLAPGRDAHDERDWTDPDAAGTIAYERAKTLAERAAWEFVCREAPEIALTAINPAFALGPSLDRRQGSSTALVARILGGRDPMLPRCGLAFVDVRDVAEMHLRALEMPHTAGQRFIGASGSMWLAEMGQVLKRAYPGLRIPTREAPDLLVRGLALFSPTLRTAARGLGRKRRVSAARAEAVMGMRFIPPDEALLAMAKCLMDQGQVR